MTGFEPLITAATLGVMGIVTGIIQKEGTNVFTRLLSQDIGKSTQQKIFNASQKYVETYTNRHGLLKVLGMREPVNLDDVYTAVVLLDSAGRRSFSSIEDLEKAYKENPRKPILNKKDQKKTGVKVANNTQFLMVLGAPGAGKSTFLRKIGLEALKGKKGKYKYSCIPVMLELKRFTEDQIDIQHLIANEFKNCGFPNPKRFTERALKQGRLLILLDGLDEVPTKKRDSVIDTIQDFVDNNDNNRFITSCRVAAYRNNFRRFTDVIMAEFGDGQIEKYIYNWFRSEEDQKSGTAKRYWELFQKPENKAAKELAHTPLLLTFLCLVYDRSQKILNNRSTLYKKALRILLEEWAAEKRILREEIYQGLSIELEELLLSEIAYERLEADRLFILQDDLVNKIRTFLTSNLNAPKHLSGKKVLSEIAIQQGVLVERAEDIYSFSHLTLQEYLTAKYIIDHDKINTLVEKYLSDRSWREVFLLVAGAMPVGADLLLISMSKSAQQMVQSTKVQALFQWVDRIVVQQSNANDSLLLRLDMIALILACDLPSTNDLASALASANDRVIALASKIVSASALDLASELASARTRATALATALAGTLDRTDDFASTSALTSALARASKIVSASALDLASTFASNLDNEAALTRTLASSLARSLSSALALANTLNDREEIFSGVNFSELAENLKILRTQQPGIKKPFKNHQEFSGQLLYLLCDAFQINESILDLKKEDAELLESYLYVITLIVQCKKEAIRVSPDTWRSVVNKMLAPN